MLSLSLLCVANVSRFIQLVPLGRSGKLVLLVENLLFHGLELVRLELESKGKSKKGLLTDVLPQAA